MFFNFLLSFKVLEIEQVIKSPELLSTVRRLTLGQGSGMNRALDHYTELLNERPVKAKAIMATYRGQYIAWALFTYETDNLSFHPKDGEACVQIYVEPKFRRNGVGTGLIHLAKIMSKGTLIRVYSYDNQPFFSPLVEEGICHGLYE